MRDTIDMAREAGDDWDSTLSTDKEFLKRFEALVRADERAALVQKPTIENNSQNWQGMDGATAWHLIDRHADGWADVAKMMGEWLAANTPPAPAPVPHQVIAGVLFSFMGWLTSREARLTLSSTDDASPAVEAITEFAKMRGLSLDDARVQDWQDGITKGGAA